MWRDQPWFHLHFTFFTFAMLLQDDESHTADTSVFALRAGAAFVHH